MTVILRRAALLVLLPVSTGLMRITSYLLKADLEAIRLSDRRPS